MSELTSKGRSHIAAGNFALPGRRYPIHDKAHARNALARIAQHGTAAEKKTVRAAVHAKFPDIGDEKTAAMNKEALWPLLIPAAAAALPWIGQMRHNPTFRYNVGGQELTSQQQMHDLLEPGQVVITRPQSASVQIPRPGQPAIPFGHADFLYHEGFPRQHNEASGLPQGAPNIGAIFVPMKTTDFVDNMIPNNTNDGPFGRKDFSILRHRTATPEQLAAMQADTLAYANVVEAVKEHLNTGIKKRMNDQGVFYDYSKSPEETARSISSAIRKPFVSKAPYVPAALDDLLGYGPGSDPKKDPLALKLDADIAKMHQDPKAYAEGLLDRIDWGDVAQGKQRTDTDIINQIKNQELFKDCAMGRCSTSPAYFMNKHLPGGAGIDKPLEHIAPADFLYARNLEPVAYHAGETGFRSKFYHSPEFRGKAMLSGALGATALAGVGTVALARRALAKRVPWHKQFRRSLMAGEYGKAGKALREGAMLALKKLGLKA